MASVARETEAPLSVCSSPTKSDPTENKHQAAFASMKTEKELPVEKLSSMQMLYAIYSECHLNVVGQPTGPFAFFDDAAGTLNVLSDNDEKICHWSPEDLTVSAMNTAQKLRACFIVHGEQVICTIPGVSQAGATYGEAALRAILAHTRVQNADQADVKSGKA